MLQWDCTAGNQQTQEIWIDSGQLLHNQACPMDSVHLDDIAKHIGYYCMIAEQIVNAWEPRCCSIYSGRWMWLSFRHKVRVAQNHASLCPSLLYLYIEPEMLHLGRGRE